MENTCGTWYTRLIRIHLKYSIAETYINGYIILQRSVRRNPIESFYLPLLCCKRKVQPKEKENMKILKILKTITRFDEPEKGFLAKANPTNPNKG